jgi:gamma-glutamylcyclotransferase (GGCT)/AIG2-like uncharacterized protein YtfP
MAQAADPEFSFYFSYGSNLLSAQMRQRCPIHNPVRPARLDNYELGFDSRGYANIRPKIGDCVWGFLWQVNKSGLRSLDRHEGCRLGIYHREIVSVIDGFDNIYEDVIVYIESPETWSNVAKRDYLFDRVIKGAEEYGLPDDWIDKLRSYPTF